jgi:two-component system, cell cycle response regulator
MMSARTHPVPPPMVDGERIQALIDTAAYGTARDLLVSLTRGVTELLGERGSCILIDGTPRVALALHAPEAAGRPVDLGRYPEIAAAVEHQRIVAIEDAHGDSRLATIRHLLPPDLGAVVAVPLVAGDRCLGVVLAQSRRARVMDETALATAALMARLVALVLASRDQASGAPAETRAPAEVAPSRHAPLRVLIIEDDADQAAVLAETLGEEGYAVERAATGADGLRRVDEVRPDLVLLDVRLPGQDGFEIAEQLRHAATTRDVPILFLSGADDLATRVRGARLDDVDFLTKPFSLAELLTRTHRALDQAAARRRLRAEAEHDELTGLGNLRLMRARMATERARFDRYGSPLALVVVDVDKLKQINDKHGHRAGDLALRSVADVLRRQIRETDLAVRYGGDEFVVLLPHTTLGEGRAFAHRTLVEIARLQPGGLPLTVSIGVAALSAPGAVETNADLLHRADLAAYRAKREGGNRVFTDEAAGAGPGAIDAGPRAD